MPKPHRIFLDRVSGYADEAGAFVRRRRHTRRVFARLYHADGSSEDLAGTDAGDRLYAATAALIELAEPAPEAKRSRG
jgi:hypothetical protein